MTRSISSTTNLQIFPCGFRQMASSCAFRLIERISALVFNVLFSLWECLAHFFLPQCLEARCTWYAMVASANFAQDQVEARTVQHDLNNETLKRICTNETRRFTRTVAIDQFEVAYTSHTNGYSEQMVFDALDKDLPRGGDVFIDQRQFHKSHEIFEELLNRGIERTRSVKILSCLSQAGCFELGKMVHQLFANYQGENEFRRFLKGGSGGHAFTMRLNFADSHLRSIDLFIKYTAKSHPPIRPLFGVNTTMRIDGTTGHAEIRGETFPLLTS